MGSLGRYPRMRCARDGPASILLREASVVFRLIEELPSTGATACVNQRKTIDSGTSMPRRDRKVEW